MTIWLLSGHNRINVMFIIITMFQDHDNITGGLSCLGEGTAKEGTANQNHSLIGKIQSKMIITDNLLTKVDREKSPISVTHIVQWKSNLNEG